MAHFTVACQHFWCRIHLWFRLMGGLQAKSMTSQRYRAVTRWRICVTMATLRQQQDGGYAFSTSSTVQSWTELVFFFGIDFLHWHGIWTGCGAHRTSSVLWQAYEDSPPLQILHLFSLKFSIAKLKKFFVICVFACIYSACRKWRDSDSIIVVKRMK